MILCKLSKKKKKNTPKLFMFAIPNSQFIEALSEAYKLFENFVLY